MKKKKTTHTRHLFTMRYDQISGTLFWKPLYRDGFRLRTPRISMRKNNKIENMLSVRCTRINNLNFGACGNLLRAVMMIWFLCAPVFDKRSKNWYRNQLTVVKWTTCLFCCFLNSPTDIFRGGFCSLLKSTHCWRDVKIKLNGIVKRKMWRRHICRLTSYIRTKEKYYHNITREKKISFVVDVSLVFINLLYIFMYV